jgi:acyl transferase domain-containing protein
MGSISEPALNGHKPDQLFVDDWPQSVGIDTSKPAMSATNSAGIVSKDVTPIAIIGMACRASGNVSSAEELWELCSRARSGWSPIPAERWSQEGYFHPNASRTGTYDSEGAHFIQEDIALFDAPFFNISASEARSIDPQQRLLLECTYEALENAGVPKETIIGQNVGVFVGGSFSEYSLFCFRDTDRVPAYEATGTAQSVLSNRLSYYFDLKGPSATVDTACSSGLSALHLACQSLRSGESSQAIVGASHLNLMPDTFISMSNSRY